MTSWIFSNFYKVKTFIEVLKVKFLSKLHDEIVALINSEEFKQEIREVNSLSFLSGLILELESENLSTEEQVKLVKYAQEKLLKNTKFKIRYNHILKK